MITNCDEKIGIILNTQGIWGGAEKRFSNLFLYLYNRYPNNIYFFVSHSLKQQLSKINPDFPFQNVFTIGKENKLPNNKRNKQIKTIPNDVKIINELDLPLYRKFYKFLKYYKIQFELYKEIDKHRKLLNIDVFLGISSGILPLYFYLDKKNRNVSIIFSNMDSWFSEIHSKSTKYWYRKYFSYNYALENSDYVDFLSPFILQGVRERSIKVKEDSISIAPCSFTDYSKCIIGNKDKFEVVFSGRLEKDKNPLLFLDAAISLSNKYPDIVFHIMGEGRLTRKVEDIINNSNYSNIIIHGFHPNPVEILTNTSVFVSIQTTNNYPSQSVLEAMACGNAIVASNVGDTRLFINENNGILIKLDKVELCNAIEYLYMNKDKINALGLYASKYVKQNHTIANSEQYYLNLFEKAFCKMNE